MMTVSLYVGKGTKKSLKGHKKRASMDYFYAEYHALTTFMQKLPYSGLSQSLNKDIMHR